MTAPSAYAMALEQHDGAVKHLRLKRGIEEYLRVPRCELAVNFPVKMDDGSVRIFAGYRVTPPGTLRVRDIMSRSPLTIEPNAPLAAALTSVREREIRHLPVVEPGSRVVGIVTDRDLRQAALARFHALRDADRDLLVQDVMTCAVVTIDADAPVSRAARLMHDRRIGSLPVVEADRLVGIVTERDMLRALMRESPAQAPVVAPFLW